MRNPYAQPAGPGPTTPEGQLASDYDLAVGKNAEYYLPKFAAFDDGGSKLGWNWPAFFVTTPWFLYRKMWGWGMANLAFFWGMLTFVFPIALGVALGLKDKGGGNGAVVTVCVILGVLIAIPWFVLPVFANALYWKHIRKVITVMPASIAANPDKRMARIERNGGTGAGALAAILVGGVFFFVAIIGVLAAIAIPAYQDYTVRAQVAEGLTLASEAKAAVTDYYSQNRAWPETGADAGYEGVTGKYVKSIDIDHGSVVIVYGAGANPNLSGKTVILLPGITADDDLVWGCANGPMSGDISIRGEGPSGTDAAVKYLPAQCRPTAGT